MSVVSFAYLTSPEYLPYTETADIITAHENSGNVTLSLTGKYELSQREQGVYAISVYNTIWNKLFDTMQEQVITVNPKGEEVNTIYYVSNGGQEDTVIYGENPTADGGVMTLPRLFLNYYFAIAVFIAFVLIGVLLLSIPLYFIFYILYKKKTNQGHRHKSNYYFTTSPFQSVEIPPKS